MDPGATSFPEDNGEEWTSGTGGQHPIPGVRASLEGHPPYRARQDL